MIGYFARHRTAANLVMLVFMLLGALTLPQIQRETFPEFEPSRIQISARYPGAPTEIVDDTVTQRIQDALASVEGIATMRSTAREGSVSVSVEAADGVRFDALLSDVKTALDSIRDFPVGMDPPTVRARKREASVASLAVTGPMSPQDLKLYCEQLRRELLHVDNVSQVALAGFSTHRLRIRVNHASLARHGLTISDVSAAVKAQSLDAPIGTLVRREGDILVRYQDKRTTADTLGEIVIKGDALGGTVRVSDVAEVDDAFAIDEEQTWFNGQRACMLSVSKTATEDSLRVLDGIRAFLADQEARQPDGVAVTLTEDIASVIQERLNLLLENGLQGLLAVFFTLWLFFGWRIGFWVAMGLPVSFLGAVWVMHQLGHTLNMMTMMGLLIALGLLMDDGIVLADNVAAHLQRGKSPLRAAVDGVQEVASGVVSSFLTTVCVFIPLSAIEGRIGRILQVIPFVLIAVLAVSLIEAFFVLPNHLGHSLRSPEEHPPGRFRRWFDRGFARVRDSGIGGIADFGIRHRYGLAGLVLALLIASAGMITSGKLKYRAFPDTEGDVVQFKLEMSPGTSLDRTKQEVTRVVEAAWKVSKDLAKDQPDGKALVRNVSARFNYNPDSEEGGPNLATVTVDLLSVEVRGTTLAAFTDTWRKATGPMPSAVSAAFGAGGHRRPGGNPIEVRIEGDDLARLQEVSAEIQAYFGGFDGVFDLADDLQPGTAQVAVRLRPGAGMMNVTGATVATQLRAALSGVTVERLYDKGEEYELFVELARGSRDALADLEHFPIVLSPTVSVPLGAIARIDPDRSFAQISRVNGVKTATVKADLDRDVANAAELMGRFTSEKVPDLEQRYPDVRLVPSGEAEESAQTMGSMGRGLFIGLFGIFVLLSLQFRSYIEPIVVMLAIPFAFVGVVLGSVLIGQPLSSQSGLGFVSLAGVGVNDSILLIVFIKDAIARGVTPLQAASQASRDRFRAGFLTSATTVVGLVPLMFETSRQAQSLIPVATSIVFGITASTLLVLFVLPAIYVLLADLGWVGQPEEPDEPAVGAPPPALPEGAGPDAAGAAAAEPNPAG